MISRSCGIPETAGNVFPTEANMDDYILKTVPQTNNRPQTSYIDVQLPVFLHVYWMVPFFPGNVGQLRG